MKKIYMLIGMLALLLIACKTTPAKLVRLTIVNKSGMDIELTLTGTEICDANGNETENSYFLRVVKGNRTEPAEKTFTVISDTYQINAYFDELWDPVYGNSCENRQSRVDVTHNTRVVVFECSVTPPNGGEAPFIKLGGSGGGRLRR
jgi:hypothetical protein